MIVTAIPIAQTNAPIRLAADIGGTFTDVVLETPSRRHSCKVLTTPRQPELAVMEGLDRLLKTSGLEAARIELFVHGTTLATNFERLRINYKENQGQVDDVEVVKGSATSDAFYASDIGDNIVLGLNGNDTFYMNSGLRPFVMAGAGDDMIVFSTAGLNGNGNGNSLRLHGGPGYDTLAMDSGVTGQTLHKPTDSDAQITSIEAFVLSQPTASGATPTNQANVLQMSVEWFKSLSDAGATRSLHVSGNTTDKLELLATDGWNTASSSESGYALYTTMQNEISYNLYVGTDLTVNNTLIAPVIS
jgi:hypothetical protein